VCVRALPMQMKIERSIRRNDLMGNADGAAMTAFALHLPERQGFSRWILAFVAIITAHAAIVASVALWYARTSAEPTMLPAIAVTLVPVQGSSPEMQDQDIPAGPAMQQAEAAPQEPPKVEDKPVDTPVQAPPRPEAEVTLPQEEQKEIEKPKPEPMPPAPETRAPPKSERVGRFSEAASNVYDARVSGHLQRFIRYPMEARGASGTVVVRFQLNRAGEVIACDVKKSSGNQVFDRAAVAILRRASPFPAFPAAKPGDQDSFIAPMEFYR
jgi:periplasmic protein TonB